MANGSQPAPDPIRFGVFEFDPKAGELRKNGSKLRLEGQPLRILAVLLERAGEMVAREELKQKLWGGDTFVDFEHGINTGIRRLREALDDSAETPRYIETLPRRGYRFIYPVNGEAATRVPPTAWLHGRKALFSVGLALAITFFLMAVNVGGIRDRFLGPAVGEIQAIAVLPLRNISGNPEHDYLSAGITEMLITELGRVPTLRVPSHQTVLQFSGTKTPLPEIARELQVDALIEGTVMRQGDRIRITINFVQVHPERHLLSEKYDHDLSNILQVQDDVTRAVTSRIRTRLTPEQAASRAQSKSLNAQANDAFLKGQFHASRATDRDRAKAHEYFRQVVQIEPGFAPAYARMALLDAHGGAYRAAAGGAQFRVQARQMALKALELDETQAEAHVALAWLEFSDWDFAGADREFKRAIELNPSLSVARIWYISYLTCMRRIEEADAQGEIVLRLNPASADTLSHVASHYLYSGRVERAMELYREALDLDPNWGFARWSLGRAYYVKRMYAESVAELEKAIEINGRNVSNLAVLAPAYIKAGRRAEGLAVLRELEGQWEPGGRRRGGTAALAYAGLGEKDTAFERLEAAYERRGLYVTTLLAEPLFDPLRSDPRFHDLARRVGFPAESLRRAGIPTDTASVPASAGNKP